MPSKKPVAPSRPPVGHPDYEFPQETHNLLGTAQAGHLALSEMADNKASILMGATFVVFALVIEEITSNQATPPLFILAVFSFLSTVLSVMALRPRVMKPPSLIGPKTNVVFFGAFSGISEEQYVDHMVEILRSEEDTFRTMARDLYQNGRVLQFEKYRYLSYAYTIFLIGLIGTFVAFLIEMVLKSLA